MLRLAPIVIIALLVMPVTAGLGMVLLPAFGYLPVLGSDQANLFAWQMLFAQPGLGRSVAVSFASGLASTALALLIVVLFLAASQGTWLDLSLRRLVSPLLAIPHAAVAFGFAFLIAPSGLMARLISPWLSGWEAPPDALIVNDPWGLALTLGLVLKDAPFLLLMSLAALPQLQAEQRLRLARSLGYSPTVAWLKGVLPSLYPLIRLPVYAVIAYATSVVDMALILGPRLPPTLSVSILGWFSDPDLTRRFMASAAAVLQLGVTLAALLSWWLLEQLARRLGQRWLINGERTRGDAAVRVFGRVGLALASAAALASLAGLGLFSVAGFWRFPELLPQSLTVDHWQRSVSMLAGPLTHTALIALLSTGVAAVLVVATLENEQRQQRHPTRSLWLLYLPLLVPQIAFLYGLVVTAERLGIRPQLALVVAGHLLFVLPYVYLSLAEAYRRLDPRWLYMAQSLGVSRRRAFWRVRLPLLLAPLLTAAAVGLAVSIGQYLPTQLLGAGRVPTVAPGDVLTVMGPSGSGKSTLLAFIAGFLPNTFAAQGRVRLGDTDILRLPAEQRGVGLLFQDPLLFPHLSVGGNLRFGLPRRSPQKSAQIAKALDQVGLAGFEARDPATLSGGQQARVALMRLLLSQPRAVLLDEPFSKLDTTLRQEMRALVFSQLREAGLPALLVTHDDADATAAGGPIIALG